MKLKVKTLHIAQFKTREGILTYSTLAVMTDGSVWRYDPPCHGWVPYKMEMVPATCGEKGHNR